MTLAMTMGMTIGIRRTLWMMAGELVGVGLVALLSVIGVAALIIFFGLRILLKIDQSSPFAPHAIQLAGLVIIVPVLLVLAIVTDLPNEALTGFLGTIVGYFFGVSKDNA